jgi:hypothetical protein
VNRNGAVHRLKTVAPPSPVGKYSDLENRRSYFEECCLRRIAGIARPNSMTVNIHVRRNDLLVRM